MLGECLEYLAIRPDGIYSGRYSGIGRTFGRDRAEVEHRVRDRERSRRRIVGAGETEHFASGRIESAFTTERFRNCAPRWQGLGIERVDGLLADLGVSRYQLTEPERGFSLMADGPLDMRQDRSQELTADEIVNFTPEKELADLIYRFGEERRSRRISRAIVRARPIHSTQRLSRVIEVAVPRTSKIHPATQTFQALRMAVNDEQGELDDCSPIAPDLVKSGGRIVVLSFMSLEDRKVKQSFQALARAGRAEILTKHVVRPSSEEIKNNPPSRSAKLRAVEMK